MRFGKLEASPDLSGGDDGTVMELEVGSEGGSKGDFGEAERREHAREAALNRRIAITVVALSVLAGLVHIRDEETVHAMERAEAAALDTWNQYQATRTKLHQVEIARWQLQTLADPAKAGPALAEFDRQMAKYQHESPGLKANAEALESDYTRAKAVDDRFHLAEAALSIAVSLAAVASLLEFAVLLYVGWAFGAAGLAAAIFALIGG